MKKSKVANRGSYSGLLWLIVILCLTGFSLISLKDETFELPVLLAGVILSFMFAVHYFVCSRFFPRIDPIPLIITYLLVGVGMIMQWRMNPDIGAKQMIWVGAGMIGMIVLMLLLRNPAFWIRLKWLLIAGSIGLLVLALGIGAVRGGARNWVDIGGFSFQPSEFVKIALIYIAAAELSEKKKISLLIWPLFAFAGLAIVMLVLARDLGAALIYAVTLLAMFYVATGSKLWTGIGIVAGAGASVLAYNMFDHIKVRVAVWRNPWADYHNKGFQIAQGLIAIASGGLFGMGLGQGSGKIIPEFYTDYVFAIICEELGIIVGMAIIVMYVLLILRGIAAGLSSKNSFNALLSIGVTSMLAIQTFLILGGILKLIPLTGVTLPFVSYGGSSMIGSFLLIGVLEAVIIDNKRSDAKDRDIAMI